MHWILITNIQENLQQFIFLAGYSFYLDIKILLNSFTKLLLIFCAQIQQLNWPCYLVKGVKKRATFKICIYAFDEFRFDLIFTQMLDYVKYLHLKFLSKPSYETELFQTRSIDWWKSNLLRFFHIIHNDCNLMNKTWALVQMKD